MVTLEMICNDLRINLFTMKLTKPQKHPDSHPNPPPVYPLHPRLICVCSVWFPSIWPIYLPVLALLWPNEWYYVSLVQFFHVIHHLATEMHCGCHSLSPKSLPTLNQLFCLKTFHPIAYIASQEVSRYMMTIKIICNDLGTDLFTMKHVNPPKHPHSHSNLLPVHPLHSW